MLPFVARLTAMIGNNPSKWVCTRGVQCRLPFGSEVCFYAESKVFRVVRPAGFEPTTVGLEIRAFTQMVNRVAVSLPYFVFHALFAKDRLRESATAGKRSAQAKFLPRLGSCEGAPESALGRPRREPREPFHAGGEWRALAATSEVLSCRSFSRERVVRQNALDVGRHLQTPLLARLHLLQECPDRK